VHGVVFLRQIGEKKRGIAFNRGRKGMQPEKRIWKVSVWGGGVGREGIGRSEDYRSARRAREDENDGEVRVPKKKKSPPSK